MYIVRWLMGHPIIAIWVLGAIAILLQIAGGNNKHEEQDRSNSHAVTSSEALNGVVANAEVKHELDKTIEPVDNKKSPEVSESTTLSSDGSIISIISGATGEADSDMAEEVPNEDNGEAETSIVTSVEEVAGSETVVAVISGDTNKQTAKVSNPKSPLVAEHVVTTTQADLVSSAQQVMPNEGSDIGQMRADEILLMAREAYWNNGLDEAAGLYTQLIKLQPDVMEYKGELGNVYWRLGLSKKAAELYSEIAIPMLQRGDINRVANMLGFIGLFYPDRAAEIHQKIMSMQNNNQ